MQPGESANGPVIGVFLQGRTSAAQVRLGRLGVWASPYREDGPAEAGMVMARVEAVRAATHLGDPGEAARLADALPLWTPAGFPDPSVNGGLRSKSELLPAVLSDVFHQPSWGEEARSVSELILADWPQVATCWPTACGTGLHMTVHAGPWKTTKDYQKMWETFVPPLTDELGLTDNLRYSDSANPRLRLPLSSPEEMGTGTRYEQRNES